MRDTLFHFPPPLIREQEIADVIDTLRWEKTLGDGLTETMGLDKLDDWLLMKFPSLKRFCRLVVIHLRKGQKPNNSTS